MSDQQNNDQQITMLTYIKESPAQVAANIERAGELTGALVDAYVDGGFRNVWIVACGSSNNGSQCAKPFMMKYLGVDVQVIPSESFLIYKNNVGEKDFVMVVSQSGCSTNSIAALEKLREMGRPAIGLTGNVDSDFKDHCDVLVDWGVGEEKVGYVTKGVTTLAQFLMLFALEAGVRTGACTAEARDAVMAEMAEVPGRHETMQQLAEKFYAAHRRELTSLTVAYSAGFAQGYGIACEAALKIGETVKVPSFPYEAEEYIHGPNLQLTPNYTIFLIDDELAGSDRLVQIWQASNSVSDKAYCVTNSPVVDDDHAIRMPFDAREPLLSPLYVLPVFQLIAFHASDELRSIPQHPMFDQFKKYAESKTESISRIMPLD